MFSKPIHKLLIKSIGGFSPHLETPPTVIDSCPSAMLLANGGLYAKKDKLHLDKNAVGETHNTPVMPRNIFEAETLGRGLAARLSSLAADKLPIVESAPVVTDETVVTE